MPSSVAVVDRLRTSLRGPDRFVVDAAHIKVIDAARAAHVISSV